MGSSGDAPKPADPPRSTATLWVRVLWAFFGLADAIDPIDPPDRP